MTTCPTTDDFYPIEAIGRLHSCFPDKFGVPRQPGLSAAARGEIEILPPYDRPEAFRGLEGVSHIWVTFIFHGNLGREWQPTIRPPRLGGNKRIGVFASRSSFRPNGLGLSLLRLTELNLTNSGVRLTVAGVDIIDQTPIVDIKPYLPYADAAPNAHAGWADPPPQARLTVLFSPEADADMSALMDDPVPGSRAISDTTRAVKAEKANVYPLLDALIAEVLEADPRPTYRRGKADPKIYATRLYDLEVRWQVKEDRTAWVISVAKFFSC